MMREMLQAKLHRATVTDCRLNYPGSLTVDTDLIDLAGMLVHQKVQVVNVNNGERLETYLIAGRRGKREIIVNGAAARLAQTGDRIIVMAYALYSEEELKTHHPITISLDLQNQIIPDVVADAALAVPKARRKLKG